MPRRARDVALVVLVVVNVILLCTLLAHVAQLPQAGAQAVPEAAGGNRFLVVSGLVDTSGTNALYVLDASQQRLYVWVPSSFGPTANMVLRDVRDLRADFARQPAPAVPPRGRP